MIRLFEQSYKRKIYDLDGVWKFATDSFNTGFKQSFHTDFPADEKNICVPCSWNCLLGMENYIGVAWMKTEFVTEKKNIKIVFGAVNNDAIVYIDGNKIGEHIGGFTEFSFIVENLEPGNHILTLRIDNTQTESDTIPLKRADWFNHGGIMRSVEIHEFDNVIVDNIKIDYDLDLKLKKADISLNTQIYCISPIEDSLVLKIDSQTKMQKNIKLNSGINTIKQNLSIENIKIWDIDSPNLYMFTVAFGEDELNERTGFRTIEIKGKDFILNGRKIIFKGVNRHEEHPDWGFAVPFSITKKDVDIICDMNCNIIRGSHYPNSKLTLDYLDERGVLFWEEIPMWGFPEEPLKNERVKQIGNKMHEEMVARDFNHPCIIIWGLHNEIATDTQAAYEMSEEFIKTLRRYDTKRLITFASMKPEKDICFPLADFISMNKYIGWYEGTLKEWDKFIDDFHTYLAKFDCEGKPVVISEFGAGGIWGNVSLENLKWTENYQAEAIDYMIKVFLRREDIAGMFIWQYCDMRSSHDMELTRARSYNNKGMLNEYRKPKMAYYAVKKAYAE